MSLTSRVSIADGTTTANIDGHATLDLSIRTESAGGAVNLRMADGSITRQVLWEKKQLTIDATGWRIPDVSGIDWSKQLTVTVVKAGGTEQYVGYANEPPITRKAGADIQCSWSLTLSVG